MKHTLLLIVCASFLFGMGYIKLHAVTPSVSQGRSCVVTQQDSSYCPLTPFYLSYPEWKTISCIVAVNKRKYWDKEMIALIETSGKLRVSFRNNTSYLDPVKKIEMKKGEWSDVFKNDSLEIHLSANLDEGEIMSSLTGNGTITIRFADQVYDGQAYYVFKSR